MANIILGLTRPQISQMVQDLLFGFKMSDTLLNNFLDVAQAKYENMRPWMILRTADSSLTVGTANTFTTPFTIAPTNLDFRRWYSNFPNTPIVLTDAQNNPIYYDEVPIEAKFTYQNMPQKFYCDYSAGNLFLCGPVTRSYALNQFYLKKGLAVSYSADGISYPNTWLFPAEYHKILPLDIALMYKQVDYDIINLQNANMLNQQVTAMLDQMTRWDSELQRFATQSVDPFGGPGAWLGTNSGGTIGIY